jgi:hypothetical protein
MSSNNMNTEIPKYPLFIVYSRKSVDYITNFLGNYGALGHDGVYGVHVCYDMNGNETNRSLVLCEEDIYEDLVAQGYEKTDQRLPNRQNEFLIDRYRFFPDNHHPKNEQTYNFFIKLPPVTHPAFTDCKASHFVSQLERVLNELVRAKVLPDHGYHLNVPMESRTTGKHRGVAYVTFDKNVDRNAIAAARVYIDHFNVENTKGDTFFVVRCLYAFDNHKNDTVTRHGKEFQPKQIAQRSTELPVPQ